MIQKSPVLVVATPQQIQKHSIQLTKRLEQLTHPFKNKQTRKSNHKRLTKEKPTPPQTHDQYNNKRVRILDTSFSFYSSYTNTCWNSSYSTHHLVLLHRTIWQAVLGNCLEKGQALSKILWRWLDELSVYHRLTSTNPINELTWNLPKPVGKQQKHILHWEKR